MYFTLQNPLFLQGFGSQRFCDIISDLLSYEYLVIGKKKKYLRLDLRFSQKVPVKLDGQSHPYSVSSRILLHLPPFRHVVAVQGFISFLFYKLHVIIKEKK